MDVPCFKTVIIYVAVVCACQTKMDYIVAAEDVIVSLCGRELKPGYSSLAMTNIASLIEIIPVNGYNVHTSSFITLDGETLPYWGLGACNGEVDLKHCFYCLMEAMHYLNQCYGKAGGQVKLSNCRLRYETYEFNLNW